MAIVRTPNSTAGGTGNTGFGAQVGGHSPDGAGSGNGGFVTSVGSSIEGARVDAGSVPGRESGTFVADTTTTGAATAATAATTGSTASTATTVTATPTVTPQQTATGGRDFYREARQRERTPVTRDVSRAPREDVRGDFSGRHEHNGDWREVLRSHEGDVPRQDMRRDTGHREERGGYREERGGYREEHTGGRGRGLAMAAAGLGAVGVGLLRRSRWQREALTAGELMSRDVRTVRPEHSLRDVAMLMREENVGIVPVCDTSGRLLGVVTDRDLVVRAMLLDRVPSQVFVRDVMSSDDLEVATPDDSVHEVLEMMGRKQVRRVPVVERDSRLVGIIAMADIATRADRDEELQDALERISSRRSFWSRLT
jgi:CBS domain-containing protein